MRGIIRMSNKRFSVSKKVFVSSRLDGELDHERAVASRVISDMGLKPILWENEASVAEHNQKWWRHQIDNSGLLVLLLGSSISPAIYDEVSTAIGLNKRLVVFCKDIGLISHKKLASVNWETEESCREALDWLYNWLARHRLNRIENDASFEITLRDAVADALEFKETVPQRYLIDSKEIDRIRSLYVPPRNYNQAKTILAEKRLLLLLGPPHIGKTATALYLLAGFFRTKSLRSLLTCSSSSDLAHVAGVCNAGILLDDAFGKVIFDEGRSGNESQAILALAENNYVIITSRAEVFREALTYTRFGEVSVESNCVYLEQEGSYDDEKLGLIFQHHLELALDRGLITEEQGNIANRHRAMIVKELRFPHNIERFAMVHLSRVRRPGDIQRALRQSKEVEKASGQWYRRLHGNQKAIAIALAICGFENWNHFNACVAAVAHLVGTQVRSVFSDLVEMGSYISVGEKLAFGHPSYHVGVIGEIACRDYAIVKQLLVEGRDSHDERILLGLALRDIAATHPNAVLALAPVLAMRPGRVKKHGIIALGKVGKEHSREAISLLKDITGGPVHRRRAVRSLTHFVGIEPELVCEALLPLVEDPNHLVRLKVAMAFSENSSKFPSTAFKVLSMLVADESAKVRRQAVSGMRKLVWDFPDEAYRVLDNLPEHAMTLSARWFANEFCSQYEKKKGLVEKANKRIEQLEKESHAYIQKRLPQLRRILM